MSEMTRNSSSRLPLFGVRALFAIGVITVVVFFAVNCGGDDNGGDTAVMTPTPTPESTKSAILEVQTIDRDSGDPISGAKVILTIGVQDGFLDHDKQKTNDKGQVVFTGLTEGLYDISVHAEGYEMASEMDVIIKDLTPLKIEMASEGEAEARFPVGDDRNFVRTSGVRNEKDAIRILITHGIVGSGTDVESASCANDAGIPITLTHPDVSIAYRDGQVVSTYTGPLVNEPVCMVVIKGDAPVEKRTWYVQQVCGNLLKPNGRPPVVKIPPTETPKREEVPSKTPTNTPPVVKTPPPSATDTPMSTKTPKKPTAAATPKNAPTNTPKKPTATPPRPPTQTPQPTFTPPVCECPTPSTPEPLPPTWEATATPVDIFKPTPTTRPPDDDGPTLRDPPEDPPVFD